MSQYGIARRRLLSIASVAAVSAMVLAGCAAGGDDSDASGSEVEVVSRAPIATGEVDSITWNLPEGEPASIDPPNSPTYSGATVVNNLCDPLLSFDENFNLQPNIVDFEQPDPLTIVYKLQAEARFWDGSPVTTDDIVYSLQRSADPARSIVASGYAYVESITATSDTEVTVRFTQPDSLFNAGMATFSAMVLQEKYTEAAGASFGTASGGIMCSGPYKLADWTPGDSITIERNDDYWNAERMPLVAEATFTFVTDSTAATQALNAGEIDGSYQIDPAAIPPLSTSDEGTLYFGPSMESTILSVATPDGPLADISVRQALQLSIDREALVEAVYNGSAQPLYTALTPQTWEAGQETEYQDAYDKWVEARQYDIEAAKALVESSSYDGEPIVLGLPAGNATLSKLAQLVQQQAKKAGLEVEISEVQPLDFATAGYDAATRERLGWDVALGASFNATPQPLEPMQFVYTPGAVYNWTEWDDPRVAELLVKARAALDIAERTEILLEIQELAEENSAAIPLVANYTVSFQNKRIGGAITSFAYMLMPSIAFLGGTGDE